MSSLAEPGPAHATPPAAGRFPSPATWLAACLGFVGLVGVADYLTGREVALILFYLAPIGLGTWYVGLGGGISLAVASALVSTAADTLEFLQGAREQDAVPTAILVWNGAVQLGTFVALVIVLSALRSRLEGEELLARTDALTKISNRRAFFEAAGLEIERTRRSGRPLALTFVDIDDFKDVNDRRGHAQGDALLVAVAHTLRGATRAVDSVARLGGDEFAILLPEVTPVDVEPLLERIRAALLATSAQQGWNVGFSFGAAVFVGPPASADEMMACADALMYDAKRHAKGTIRVGTFGDPQPHDEAAASRR